MIHDREPRLDLRSTGPHAVRLTTEAVGRDLLCRVHGGDAHVGSVALSEWRDGRAHTRCLTARDHREEAIARHAAHLLCGAARRTVACVAGIHFDDVTRPDIEAISRDAYELARRAGRRLRDVRIREAIGDPAGVLAGIRSAAAGWLPLLDEVLALPVPEGLESLRGRIEEGRPEGPIRPVRLFAPLYLSNACTNDCVYCGFRRTSAYRRTRLTVEETVDEARALAARGFRTLDLVTGEVPSDPFVDYVARVTSAVLRRTEVSRVHVNVGSLSAQQYARLVAAGAAGVHVYQETYDTDAYLAAHRAGAKREMADRLEAPHRAASAGFGHVGLGALLGLGDLATDLCSLVAHAGLLRESFPGLSLGFSLPRVQPTEADPGYVPARRVSDDDFVRAVLFLRLAQPDVDVTLTTRERPEIRDLSLRFGVARLSAGVSTAPGGYGAVAPADGVPREQFWVTDGRSAEQVAAAVRRAGLEPSFQ